MPGGLSLPRLPWSRALVVGLGASGVSAARLLIAAGVATAGYDQRPEIVGLPANLQAFLGAEEIPDEAFEGIDLLVLSPGVDPRPIRARLPSLAPNATVHGELSLALHVVRETWPRVPTVLVTGTNGKSTVTALVETLLAGAGLEPFAGGNLGPPVTRLVAEVASGERPVPGALVLECSSYQLETLRGHPTDVAMILNVAPDHLSRYASMEEYADTKAEIFSGLVSDGLALLSADDPFTPRLQPDGPFAVTLVGTPDGPRVDAESLVLGPGEHHPRSALGLAGEHNAQNALFALLAARHLGVEATTRERALPAFTGLSHRMQRVETINDITYWNDSKATNVSAVLASLADMPFGVVLIVGGQGKGEDLSPLRAVFEAQARAVVAIGETASMMLRVAEGVAPAFVAESLAEAVELAANLAEPGDAVVLSPACASWDMFASFAQRGEVFMEAVRSLPGTRS